MKIEIELDEATLDEAEYDELQAEYRADMAIDRMKEEAMIGC